MGPVVSLGAVDVALYDLDQTVESMDGFLTNPVTFLSGYDLTPGERSAFESWDYGALYGMGAHPFLLFQAVRSIESHRGRSIQETLEAYRGAIGPHGRPDYIT